jgi:hypothetical protein
VTAPAPLSKRVSPRRNPLQHKLDYRWFKLCDSTSTGPSTLTGVTFSSYGLLRDDYTAKPSFGLYRV